MRARTHRAFWRVSRTASPLALGLAVGVVLGFNVVGVLAALLTVVVAERLHPRVEQWGVKALHAHDRAIRLAAAYLLLHEHRWHDACVEIKALGTAGLKTPFDIVTYQNNLAWGLAEHARRGAASLELEPETLALFDGTLGTALTLAGRHSAALPFIERALATGGTAEAQAARHYHIGCALAGLQRVDEACRHWEKVAPGSRWAALARERLRTLSSAYR